MSTSLALGSPGVEPGRRCGLDAGRGRLRQRLCVVAGMTRGARTRRASGWPRFVLHLFVYELLEISDSLGGVREARLEIRNRRRPSLRPVPCSLEAAFTREPSDLASVQGDDPTSTAAVSAVCPCDTRRLATAGLVRQPVRARHGVAVQSLHRAHSPSGRGQPARVTVCPCLVRARQVLSRVIPPSSPHVRSADLVWLVGVPSSGPSYVVVSASGIRPPGVWTAGPSRSSHVYWGVVCADRRGGIPRLAGWSSGKRAAARRSGRLLHLLTELRLTLDAPETSEGCTHEPPGRPGWGQGAQRVTSASAGSCVTPFPTARPCPPPTSS